MTEVAILACVPTKPLRPLRARNAEEKKRRRTDILNAAERLWLNKPYHDLSMIQVAREAKLAKGTLYLYFDTKEELFLTLLAEQLQAWLVEVQQALAVQQPRTAAECADLLLNHAQPQEPLRRLLILLTTVIDSGVSTELSQNFRRTIMQYVSPIADLLPFERDVNLRILMHLYALAIGWQLVAQEPGATIFPAGAEPRHVRPTFRPEFQVAFRAVIEAIVAESGVNSKL